MDDLQRLIDCIKMLETLRDIYIEMQAPSDSDQEFVKGKLQTLYMFAAATQAKRIKEGYEGDHLLKLKMGIPPQFIQVEVLMSLKPED